MKLEPEETILLGSWKFDNSLIVADVVEKRIEWLTSNYLIEIGVDDSGWCRLYQDPEDQRYWELTFPQGEMHGGGPRRLENVSFQELKDKV